MTSNLQKREEHGQTLWQWLPQFFRHELAPYPGRWSLVARMVIAATASMIVIVTFRIPYGAIGVNCAFILSRENLTSTAKSGFYFILAFAGWAALIPIGARMFASIPITHFLWEGVTAFLCFFLLKTLTNFPLATGVVVVATATMAIWYLPGPADLNVELTLWQILATAIGALITFLVEVIFRSWHPSDPLLDGMDERLRTIESMLHDCSIGGPIPGTTVGMLTQYALAGTGMLREKIARNHISSLQRLKMNAVVSLLGQCIDLSAALVSSSAVFESPLREYAADLETQISEIRQSIRTNSAPVKLPERISKQEAPPLLSQLGIVIGLMESVLRSTTTTDPRLATLDESGSEHRIFVKDAFTNPEYLKYALAGTAASMLCYVIYVGLNWPGISTAVTTCVLTALSNIGSSRQKQMLRITGASIDGFVLGLGSQIFVLPNIDSITGLTILLALVTGISAYVATSSSRLSYVGLQMAFAFYLINVTDFSISRDLTIGRDRTVGILLGIGAMWLVFERLYSHSAGIEMVAGFSRTARLIASLTATQGFESGQGAIERIRTIRNEVSGLFTSVNAEADAVPFESGSDRLSHLAARERIRRWVAILRTVYVLELPLVQSRLNSNPSPGSATIPGNDDRFYEAVSASLNHIADCLESQLKGTTYEQLHHQWLGDLLAQQERRGIHGESVPENGSDQSFHLLAKLVDELEREVLEGSVYSC